MITYCLGDAAVKRAAFRLAGKASDAACADNDEVLGAFDYGGKRWFAIGDAPFGKMTVAEYVAYQKSLVTKSPVRDAEIAYYARVFNLKSRISTRLKRLNPTEYRLAQLLARYDLGVKDVYLNFDGLCYSRGAAKAVARVCERLGKRFSVFVAVGDYRFIPRGAAIREYSVDGRATDVELSRYVGRRASVRALRRAAGCAEAFPGVKSRVKSAAVFDA